MTNYEKYFVIKVQLPDSSIKSLVFVLDSSKNLMDQILDKVSNVIILEINYLGPSWI